MKIRKLMILLLFALALPTFALSETPKKARSKPEVIPPRPTKAINRFIDKMVKTYKFNRKKLTKIMSHAEYDPKVIHWITHPFEKKPWNFYRRYFVRPDRIEKGVQYWLEHQKTLKDVQNRYGVPPQVIIAIIGIESLYGKHAGTYNELNALTTLSFYYPKRQKFFQSELTHFLLLARHEKLNPLVLKGSYAGALGIPQFMPSSYRHYGIDYSKNQSIDLFTNHLDAIASIANYLNQAGWTQGAPVAVPAITPAKIPSQLISKTGKPRFTLSQFRRYKIKPATQQKRNYKAALIAMDNVESYEYWLVFRNFRAIMRYNPRTTYALAVFELSQEILKAHDQHQRESTATSPAGKTARSRDALSRTLERKPKATRCAPRTGSAVCTKQSI